ncbi:MAG: Rieske 2Fe-2S domain-containing protein [Chloroflexota bacterium]
MTSSKHDSSEESPNQELSSTNRRLVVAQVADLPPGERKIITVRGREVGVFNVGGEFYALRNICPHRGAPLCHGRIRPLMVSSGVYHVERERESEILKCPWHQWEFDIKTGRALCDERMRVKTYKVVQEGDEVVLYG